ncbi:MULTISPECIES: PRC-barrel domain-containing protein [Ponticoccus]|uniref:PRC-barrel domain-containing protein n=1 Tax=Ponticoccus litoralis TaxID=422297 RepID=A0AAW9S4W7_9RHOB
MKRFLMTTAVAALVPMYALAQEEPADGTVLPTDDPAATAQADTDAAVDPAAEAEADADVAEAEDADPMAEDADADVADAETADPMAEGAEDPAMADAADPAADPMAEDADMAAADDGMGGALGIQGMVPVSAISGGVVYTTTVDSVDENWEGTASYDAIGEGWERIGSIHDVVLSSEGKIEGIVAEVGGFLGIGDKFVMLPTTDFKLVPIDESSYAVVTPYTTDQLTDMETYDSTM